jgi:hypothetical protein
MLFIMAFLRHLIIARPRDDAPSRAAERDGAAAAAWRRKREPAIFILEMDEGRKLCCVWELAWRLLWDFDERRRSKSTRNGEIFARLLLRLKGQI